MKYLRALVVVVYLVVVAWGFGVVAAGQVRAVVCCGMYTCVKREGEPPVVTDSYGVNCNSYTVGQCGGAGCQTGYSRENDSCEWKDGSSCSSGGSTDDGCKCGLNTQGTACKSCNTATAPECPVGTSLKCGSPSIYQCERYRGNCWNVFPSRFVEWNEWDNDCSNGESNRVNWCYTNCGCCTASQVYVNGQGCVESCNAVAPSAGSITFVQGSDPTKMTVNWIAGSNGVSQRFYVDEDIAEVNNSCPTAGDCEAKVVGITPFTAGGAYSQFVEGLEPDTPYFIRIVTYKNASCIRATTKEYRTNPANQISGRVYLDVSNTCNPTAPGWNLGGITVTASNPGTYSGTVGGSGNYAFVVGNEVAFENLGINIPEGYTCATGAGCPACPNKGGITTSTFGGNNFFLTQSREAWWQAEGAGIYAGGSGGVRSILPTSSTRLILGSALGGSEGALITREGSVALGFGELSDRLWIAQSLYRGKTLNFDAFGANMGLVQSSSGAWTFGSVIDLEGYPEEDEFGYKNGNGVIADPITVAPGQSYVIFVRGDLAINADIVVQNGGFLAMIVKGDVYVDPSVNSVQGLYVIDDIFYSLTNGGVDNPLDFQGSLVTWGSVTLRRDLDDGNISLPGEKFSYRPDLLVNMPDRMKTFLMQWQEVVAGTVQ